jgi:hypothetical protein
MQCTTGVNNWWQMEKSSIRKGLNIFFGHLRVVELTYRQMFFFKFTLRCKQSYIVPIICQLPPCGKFATGVADTCAWCALACTYLCKFLKKFEMTLKLFSGLGGR